MLAGESGDRFIELDVRPEHLTALTSYPLPVALQLARKGAASAISCPVDGRIQIILHLFDDDNGRRTALRRTCPSAQLRAKCSRLSACCFSASVSGKPLVLMSIFIFILLFSCLEASM